MAVFTRRRVLGLSGLAAAAGWPKPGKGRKRMGWQVFNVVVLHAGNTIINPNGEFVYSSAPAFGNLIYSVAGANGTDPYGNAYVQGSTSYRNAGGGTYWALQTFGVTETWFVSTAGAGGPYTQFADIGFGFASPNLGSLLVQANNQISFGNSQAMVWNDTGASSPSQLTLPAAGGPFISGESFHDVSGGSGNTCRVKKVPWNGVWLDFEGTWAGVATTNMGSLPDSSYYPTIARHIPVSSNAAAAQNAAIFIPTSGAIQLVTKGGAGAGAGGCSAVYPTN